MILSTAYDFCGTLVTDFGQKYKKPYNEFTQTMIDKVTILRYVCRTKILDLIRRKGENYVSKGNDYW